MRQALESEYVSDNLHDWIDMIWGCKQKQIDGQEQNEYRLFNECHVSRQRVEEIRIDRLVSDKEVDLKVFRSNKQNIPI